MSGVTLNKTSTSVAVGANETLAASVAPEDATNKVIVWSTSDAAKATVENGKVTGMAAGAAVITATSEDGGKTATCKVTVTAS